MYIEPNSYNPLQQPLSENYYSILSIVPKPRWVHQRAWRIANASIAKKLQDDHTTIWTFFPQIFKRGDNGGGQFDIVVHHIICDSIACFGLNFMICCFDFQDLWFRLKFETRIEKKTFLETWHFSSWS